MIIKKKHNVDNSNEDAAEPKKEVEAAKDDEIFSQINIDNIKFEQRAERRQGSRRRGYRRIDDRNLISRAQEEAISIREAAAKEGHKIGIQSAKDDINNLNNAINEFFSYKEEVCKELSKDILDISVEIAKKIINIELETNDDALLNIINNALSTSAKGENHILIKVRPEDVDNVKSNLPEILSNSQFEAKIVVAADESISLGGAIIETNNGVVDATIESQIEIIKEAFKVI